MKHKYRKDCKKTLSDRNVRFDKCLQKIIDFSIIPEFQRFKQTKFVHLFSQSSIHIFYFGIKSIYVPNVLPLLLSCIPKTTTKSSFRTTYPYV